MSTVKLGSADAEFFKNYDRKFIQLSRDKAMLIHLFEKDANHSWEDVWLHDFTGVAEKDFEIHRESARQLIAQLEGYWSIAFLKALRDECDKYIHEETCKKLKKDTNGNKNENV